MQRTPKMWVKLPMNLWIGVMKSASPPTLFAIFCQKDLFLKEASLSGSLSKDDGVMRSSWINFILSPHLLCPHWLSNPTLKTCENFSRCSRSFSILVDIWPLIPLNAQPCIALAKSIASHDKSCQKVCKIIDMESENSLAQNPHYLMFMPLTELLYNQWDSMHCVRFNDSLPAKP